MIVKTYCARMDHGGCGILAHVEDERIKKIEGDPDCPLNRGTICAKGLAQIERLNHPDRLTYPIKRMGIRGEGKWARISWDEALDTIAKKINETIERDGPEAISFAQGTPKGLELFLLIRLANLLHIPNISTPGNICHMPRETASTLTCGFFPVPDYDHPPSCVLVWGSKLFQTNEEGVLGSQLKRALDRGAKLIVIDPRKTAVASRADLWIQPKPGTDLTFALGMLRVIIDEELFDKGFVENWTKGFPELREHLRRYPLERVSEITWVPKDLILEAARLYSRTKPASLQWGNAIEHNINSFQCSRALLILMAITGNLDIPGGNVNRVGPAIMRSGELVQIKKFPEKKEKILSPEFRLATMMGFVPSQLIVKAILTGKPHPIRMIYIQGGNPLLSYANSKETLEALKKLDFLAVSEIFLTPTAQMADIVLPAATNFEFDDIGHFGLPHGFILARPRIVEPVGESWPDSKILNELGKRLGLGQFFWNDLGECLDEILKPAGMTYDDFKTIGILKGKWEYRSYEKKGFSTPSGKIEIYSEQLKQWGYEPLPCHLDLPGSSGEFLKEYPLIFTSAKDPYFFHSAYRNIPSLRKLSPDPVLLIHPETASQSGIEEGDWVAVETKRGSIRQKAKLDNNLDPRVIVLSFGWWFPERKDLELNGWKESNLNVLTDNNPPYEPAIGSTPLRAIPCRISKSNPF
ncbi:MAG: molybdopterin-dependent oxidoreductase [Thermodesulfobacteriota bacterium]|nr:molybdopterin-dependent oxidoreductase [Thermodesulfobacteriota bacterium]